MEEVFWILRGLFWVCVRPERLKPEGGDWIGEGEGLGLGLGGGLEEGESTFTTSYTSDPGVWDLELWESETW